MIELNKDLVLHSPEWHTFERAEMTLWLDPQRPHWAATDARGAWLLSRIDGKTPYGKLVDDYRLRCALDPGKAWVETHDFLRDAIRHNLVSDRPFSKQDYQGRARYLNPGKAKLHEFWVHLLQTCNLSCEHCLVSSGPKGEKGEELSFYKGVLKQAAELGAYRFYFTGGEPMVRKDFFELCDYVTRELGAELIVLSNATLVDGERFEKLKALDREKVRFQVSLDGTTPEVNDPIRGQGSFKAAAEGLRRIAAAGFETSLTAAVTASNLRDLENLPDLAKELGASSIHLMWLHKRGRAESNADMGFPSSRELLGLYRAVRERAAELGVRLDNAETFVQRLRGRAGVKYDLSNAVWESLCLYMDGKVYPTAATAGTEGLALGDAKDQPLRSIWLDSPVAKKWRSFTLADMASKDDAFRFLTGGGDLEHAWYHNAGESDPYYPLYVEALKDAMEQLAGERVARFNLRSGYSAPVVWYAMGDEQIICEAPGKSKEWLNVEDEVRTLRSNCVLAFDTAKPYRVVQDLYGDAADTPEEGLCCPVQPAADDISHIPQEVLERFYGCGSPTGEVAMMKEGETFLDLGSGGGIDVFIAAKKVGASGKAIGVDMTDRMLAVANRNKPLVADKLGYDNMEFRKGFMEEIPVEDKSVDVITSNCVLNLSPDKRKVFAEMWRVLKDHGRICIADIVSEKTVPMALQANDRLWGECLTGALSEEEFLTELERAGFYGLTVAKKTYWKDVQGYRFYSVTVLGWKFEKRDGCKFIGQKAVYLGPMKAALDEEGHTFPRNEAVEVCTDTAAKLLNGPYKGAFRILAPDGSVQETEAEVAVPAGRDDSCCDPSEGCC